MKKLLIIAVLLLCGMLITGLEVNQIKNAQMNHQMPIVILKKNLEIGSKLNKEDLELRLVQDDLVDTRNYTQISDVVGLTLAISLSANTILTKEVITEQTFYTPSDGHAITAIKFSPEETMCWEITTGEAIHLIHVDIDGNTRDLGEVIVKGNYDQNIVQDSKEISVPVYLLVEGANPVIDDIIKSRGNGRIEAVKKN